MEADLINAYITVLNDEVAALQKAKLALQARLIVAEQERDAALKRIEELDAPKKKAKTEE